MTFRISVSTCLLALLAGCSSADPAVDGTGSDGTTVPTGGHDAGGTGTIGNGNGGGNTGGGNTGGGNTGGGNTGGDASTGGGTDAGNGNPSSDAGGGPGPVDAGTGVPLDSGSTTPPDAGSGGGGGGSTSICGAPLDTNAPTAASITKDGPFAVTSYSSGLPGASSYKSLTAYYPSKGTGPFVTVMISPGLTEVLQFELQQWAQRFASYGYVAVFVEANDTQNDSEALRATGLWDAIKTMRAESTRSGSPLAGKLSGCIVTSGHSLGGGASITVANTHPTDIKGALGFNPYDQSQNFSKIVVPTMIITGQSDSTAPPAQHGRRHYDTMSSSITKEYVEVSGGNHQSALFPGTLPGQYAVAWIKYNVDGDVRYRPFLNKAASGLSDFATTLP